MHIVAFTTNYRNLDNYADALRLVELRGGRCEVIALPWSGDPSSSRFDTCGFPGRLIRPIPELSEAGISRSELKELAHDVVQAAPDIFLICDMQSYPSNQMFGLLRDAGFRGKCVGLQHGLFQVWSCYNSNFAADYLFCFGEAHVERIAPVYRHRAFALGLPKLDRLRGVETTRSGYIAFLPQRAPEPEIIDPVLGLYERAVKMPVIVHDHPQYPSKHCHRPSLPLPPVLGQTEGWSVIDYLRHANLVLTLHSTAAIEALYLGKPVVLLPNAGLAAFDGYPGISEGFLPAAINHAFRNFVNGQAQVRQFLNRVVGGRHFNHAERVYEALMRLTTGGESVPPPRYFWAASANEASIRQRDCPLPFLNHRSQLAGLIPPNGCAAELGVAKGHFSNELLSSGKGFRLYSIDRWAGDRGHDDEQYLGACSLLEKYGVRSTVVRKSFDEALGDFAPGSLDFIYFDGYAHTGQNDGKTLRDWWSRVKPGGIFAGHDYHPKWQPTIDAVDSFAREFGLRVQLTTDDEYPSWYVRKPEARSGYGAAECSVIQAGEGRPTRLQGTTADVCSI